jgi:peptidyl-tRNA hydrolase
MGASDYILKPFKKSEAETLEMILLKSTEAIEAFISDGLEKCMTVYNRSLLSDG